MTKDLNFCEKLSADGTRRRHCSSLFRNMFRLRWDENGQVSSSSVGPNLRMLNILT